MKSKLHHREVIRKSIGNSYQEIHPIYVPIISVILPRRVMDMVLSVRWFCRSLIPMTSTPPLYILLHVEVSVWTDSKGSYQELYWELVCRRFGTELHLRRPKDTTFS